MLMVIRAIITIFNVIVVNSCTTCICQLITSDQIVKPVEADHRPPEPDSVTKCLFKGICWVWFCGC